jgi:hypothetical protein
MGLRLRDARLARDINPRDLETELRTTYRHLLAIEEGQMRLFYSDSFFCDLFTRYAIQLGFSSEQAEDMRLALHGEGPLVEKAEPPDPQAAEHQETIAETTSLVTSPSEPATVIETATESLPEPPPAPVTEPLPASPDPVPGTTAATLDSLPQNHDSTPKQTPRASEASQSLGSLWFWGAIALGLVLAVVIFTLEPASNAPQVAVATSTPKPQTSQPSGAPESNQAPGAQSQSGSSSDPAATASAGAATPVSTAQQSTAEQDTLATPAPEPPRERRISDSILLSVPDAPGSFSADAAMSIRFNVKGWVWVREFDDSVREFVVQSGQTVRFNDLPVFLVVPFPDQLTVRVENQPVTLRRNDDEKDHARYSRSMLRGLVTNP